MEPEPGTTRAKPGSWFSTKITYVGTARVQFSDPPGVVTGPARVEFDEAGECVAASIEVESVENEQKAQSLLGLLYPSAQAPGVKVLPFGAEGNRCTSIRIECPKGTIFSDRDHHYELNLDWGVPQTRISLQFHLSHAVFNATGAGQATYWALPLTNLKSRFLQFNHRLADHPLRIFPTPAIPENGVVTLSNPEQIAAIMRSRLITFEHQNSLGFIEALPDYRERIEALESGKLKASVTAVAVGALGSYQFSQRSDLERWPPVDLLRLLSLATGTMVGAPWIELRDAEGQLTQRLHWRCRVTAFVQKHRAIDEGVSGSAGRLITQALKSGSPLEPDVRAAINHVMRAWFGNETTLEDQIVHLARAFDRLCEAKGVATQNLFNELNPTSAEKVENILKEASGDISSIAKGCASADEPKQQLVLDRIAGRVSTAAQKDRLFGLAVMELLKVYGLPDGEIMEAHFRSHIRSGCNSWAAFLSRLRGTVIHQSYLTFGADVDGVQVSDVVSAVQHLHDILLRVILKEVGYDGFYQPGVIPAPAPCQVDWVTSTTSARELGYE